jgi:CDP-glycerol glycerophosphotransferase (TagB/SpsB family)
MVTRFLLDLFALPIYLISCLVPKRRTLWIFGAWQGYRYSDNSRYVFESLGATYTDVDAVWITRDPALVERIRKSGRTAELTRSWRGVWTMLRASVALVSSSTTDLSKPLLGRCKIVQLWHGTPLKKILLDDRSSYPRSGWAGVRSWIRHELLLQNRLRPDLVISPSEYVSPRLVSAWRASPDNVKVTGYPRADVILSAAPAAAAAIEPLCTAFNTRRVVLYAPTWRADPEADQRLSSFYESAELARVLERHNALFVAKLHFETEKALRERASKPVSSRITLLGGREVEDINTLLPHVTHLVTDYSSVYFDYLLLDRPIVFAAFDLEEYVSRDRELYDDYQAVTPGPKCLNWEDVASRLDELFRGPDEYAHERRRLRGKFNQFVDTGNSRRVLTEVRRLAGLPPVIQSSPQECPRASDMNGSVARA